jgi:hypothetical protein
MVPASPYSPALGSKDPKNPSSIADSGKNQKHVNGHGNNMAEYGKCQNVKSFF